MKSWILEIWSLQLGIRCSHHSHCRCSHQCPNHQTSWACGICSILQITITFMSTPECLWIPLSAAELLLCPATLYWCFQALIPLWEGMLSLTFWGLLPKMLIVNNFLGPAHTLWGELPLALESNLATSKYSKQIMQRWRIDRAGLLTFLALRLGTSRRVKTSATKAYLLALQESYLQLQLRHMRRTPRDSALD